MWGDYEITVTNHGGAHQITITRKGFAIVGKAQAGDIGLAFKMAVDDLHKNTIARVIR